MKRKTSKEILADSFRELAQSKNIDKITVRDITENCGYSSATFYRQFRDKFDLIAWDHARGVAEIMDSVGAGGLRWEDTLLAGARRFQKEKEYLANLFLHTSGHDSFILYMTEINCAALKKCILDAIGHSELDEKTEMYVREYCLGTVSLTCEWILGKYKASPEDLAEIYRLSLPAPLYVYLHRKERES